MLKKLSKRINKELAQARDYVEQAFLIKRDSTETADLFIQLASDEINHAKLLLKEGNRLLTNNNLSSYDKREVKEDDEWTQKCKHIFEWEQRLATECISELNYKISMYRNI